MAWKRLAALPLLFATPWVLACDSSLPLDASTTSIENCSPSTKGCIHAGQALHDYMEAADDDASWLTIGLQASPWRLYDGSMRILRIRDFARDLKPMLKPEVKVVELQGNWTGVAPRGGKSLAERLSQALGGKRVIGLDGFMWAKKDGGTRTTRQSFTVRKGSGIYGVRAGEDVMSALTVGWASDFQAEMEKSGDAKGMLTAAVGWDAFYLCPEKALAAFERSARFGSAIGAYNAAVMRIERAQTGDREAALELLELGAALGDVKSRELLASSKPK